MAKARQPPSRKADKTTGRKKKSKLGGFSESEIDAAEQLIQLSGDSDNACINEETSDCDTTHVPHIRKDPDSWLRKIDGYDGDDRTLCGSEQIRRNKRFKPLSEIYSLTKPLYNIDNYIGKTCSATF